MSPSGPASGGCRHTRTCHVQTVQRGLTRRHAPDGPPAHHLEPVRLRQRVLLDAHAQPPHHRDRGQVLALGGSHDPGRAARRSRARSRPAPPRWHSRSPRSIRRHRPVQARPRAACGPPRADAAAAKPGSWRRTAPSPARTPDHAHQLAAALAQGDRAARRRAADAAARAGAYPATRPLQPRPARAAPSSAAPRRHGGSSTDAGARAAARVVENRHRHRTRPTRSRQCEPPLREVDHDVRDRLVELLARRARPSSSRASSTARAGASRSRSHPHRTRTAHPRSPAPGRSRRPHRARWMPLRAAGARSSRPAAASAPHAPGRRLRTGAAAAC